jgi:hypothetical protein
MVNEVDEMVVCCKMQGTTLAFLESQSETAMSNWVVKAQLSWDCTFSLRAGRVYTWQDECSSFDIRP